jgi:hypothetical protein
MADLRKRTDVHVDQAWQARIVAGIRGRQRRRFLRPALVLSFAGVALAVWGARGWRLGETALSTARTEAETATTVATHAPAETLHFDAHATGTRISPDAEAVVAEQTPTLTQVDLRHGSVHFEIGHTGREFRVQAADVTVTVLGTSFTVTFDRSQVTVDVQRGRVRVQNAREKLELNGGERRSLNVESVAAAPTMAPTPSSAAPKLSARASVRSARASRPALRPAEGQPDSVEDLMRAADEARQAQDWSAALADYNRVVVQHGQDSRAGLASFSRGRILLHQLHRPIEAARAFAEARRLPLSASLVREALAREVEAWHTAGDDSQASGLAAEYVRRYSDVGAPAVVRERLREP